MIFEQLRSGIDITDEDFNSIYPKNIRLLGRKHWTPVAVAKTASEFLANRRGVRVLDIGSGAGKFCMIGAVNTRGHFTGIEQREELVALSRQLSNAHHIDNAEYINANIVTINFRDYDAFYLYNSFYENIDPYHKIDDEVLLNAKLFDAYSRHTFEQLSSLPSGARLATYYTSNEIVPDNFKLVDSRHGSLLNLWEKMF
jgi:SAM-dependent methyltransferase